MNAYDQSKRQAAMNKLQNIPDAIPLLRKASEDSNSPIVEQAKEILNVLEVRQSKRFLDRARLYSAHGRIDIAADFLLHAPIPSEQLSEYWQQMIDLGWHLMGKTMTEHPIESHPRLKKNRNTELGPLLTAKEVKGYFSSHGEIYTKDQPFISSTSVKGLIRSPSIQISKSAFIAAVSGDTKCDVIQESILVSNGNVKCRDLDFSFVIADGNVEVRAATSSIIIARGTVTIQDVMHCIGISSATIPNTDRLKKLEGRVGRSILVENAAKPINFVTWLDTKELGVEVGEDMQGLVISRLAPETPFAKAGCKIGDQVLTTFGDSTKTIHQFRSAVRKGIVTERVPLVVVRGKEKIAITISLQNIDSLLLKKQAK